MLRQRTGRKGQPPYETLEPALVCKLVWLSAGWPVTALRIVHETAALHDH
jgi:hypothetical protein